MHADRQYEKPSSPLLQPKAGRGNLNFEDNRPVQLHINKLIRTISSHTLQRHLFTDIATTYADVEDLGIWFGMASEWNKKKSLPQASPEKYITPIQSLYNSPASIPHIAADDKVRVLAHGDPDGVTVGVTPDTKKMIGKPDSIIDKIKTIKKYNASDQEAGLVTDGDIVPIHCFMGNKAGDTIPGYGKVAAGGTLQQLGRPTTLGKGSVIIPPSGMMSISEVKPGWKGGTFITPAGSWKKASDVLTELPKIGAFRAAPGNMELFKEALVEVYDKIKTEYEAFATQCIQTGSDTSPWA